MKTLIFFSTLCLSAFPALSSAEFVEGELYAGASAGVSIYDELDTTDVGYKLYGGYLLNDYFGLDLAYINLGDPASTEFKGVSVSAVANYPLNRQTSMFGKVGTFVWDISAPNVSSRSGNDLNFGVGVNFNAMDNLYIHAELENYQADSESIIIYSLGLALGF